MHTHAAAEGTSSKAEVSSPRVQGYLIYRMFTLTCGRTLMKHAADSAGDTSRNSGHPLRYACERAPEPMTMLAIYALVAAKVDVIAAASLPAAHIVAYFNSDATTDLTLRRFRSTYVCPQPAVIEGPPIRRNESMP